MLTALSFEQSSAPRQAHTYQKIERTRSEVIGARLNTGSVRGAVSAEQRHAEHQIGEESDGPSSLRLARSKKRV